MKKKVSISKKIAQKRIFSYIAIAFVVVFVCVALATNMFGNTREAEARRVVLLDDTYIGHDDRFDGDDLELRSGTFIMEGSHNFNSLTIGPNATLTTTDYNRYGVDVSRYENPDDASQLANFYCGPGDTRCARVATSLGPAIDQYPSGQITNDERYIFIMRGFLNVGGNSGHTFAAVDPTEGSSVGAVDSFRPDDALYVDLFSPITYDDAASGNYAFAQNGQYSFASHHGSDVNSALMYQDNQATPERLVYPFQMYYINTGSAHHWGVAYCPATGTCDDRNQFRLLETVSGVSDFSSTNAAPQLAATEAWQGNLRTDGTAYSNARNFGFVNHIKNEHWNAGTFDDYYHALNYNFRSDPKVILRNSVSMMTSPTLDLLADQHEKNANINLSSTNYTRRYVFFHPRDNKNTPLAYYHEKNAFPALSRSLYQSLSNKDLQEGGDGGKRLRITVSDEFRVESGGQVNLNGKGFGYNAYSGVGPGASDGTHGASHAGAGSLAPTGSRYDNIPNQEPLLPGSGGDGDHAISDREYFSNYGGGYIKISANTISVQQGGIISADAVGVKSFSPPKTSSGGTIVLEDSSQSSVYTGQITAWGGCADENDGGESKRHAGGGGHIYINTNLSLATIESQSNIERTGIVYSHSIDPDRIFTNSVKRDSEVGERIISVRGGNTEWVNGAVEGQPGIVSIVIADDPAGYNLKKYLKPFYRAGQGNGFNPYALKVGDIIQVMIDVTALGQNATVVDEILKVEYGANRVSCLPCRRLGGSAAGYTCHSEDGTVDLNAIPNVARTAPRPTIGGGEVTWSNINSEDGYDEIGYYCQVTEVP